MSLLVPCPTCGERPYTEFTFGGELRALDAPDASRRTSRASTCGRTSRASRRSAGSTSSGAGAGSPSVATRAPTGSRAEPWRRSTSTVAASRSRRATPSPSAAFRAGMRTFSRSIKSHRRRGLYCLSGDCANCLVTVDGVARRRARASPTRTTGCACGGRRGGRAPSATCSPSPTGSTGRCPSASTTRCSRARGGRGSAPNGSIRRATGVGTLPERVGPEPAPARFDAVRRARRSVAVSRGSPPPRRPRPAGGRPACSSPRRARSGRPPPEGRAARRSCAADAEARDAGVSRARAPRRDRDLPGPDRSRSSDPTGWSRSRPAGSSWRPAPSRRTACSPATTCRACGSGAGRRGSPPSTGSAPADRAVVLRRHGQRRSADALCGPPAST